MAHKSRPTPPPPPNTSHAYELQAISPLTFHYRYKWTRVAQEAVNMPAVATANYGCLFSQSWAEASSRVLDNKITRKAFMSRDKE